MDRAALDAALESGLPCGGWCPKGRRAEDSKIDPRYPLVETPSWGYKQRTEFNVRDSDGTLILHRGIIYGGTALTIRLAKKLSRPLLVLDLSQSPSPEAVLNWMRDNSIGVLNVAGPRESGSPGIYHEAFDFLRKVFFSCSPR